MEIEQVMKKTQKPTSIVSREKRSLALHREVVKRLREDPSLWDIPLKNIERWTKLHGGLAAPYSVWLNLLRTEPKEKIIKILLSRSQRSACLRSSSPFTGIIDQETRNRIYEKYRQPKH